MMAIIDNIDNMDTMDDIEDIDDIDHIDDIDDKNFVSAPFQLPSSRLPTKICSRPDCSWRAGSCSRATRTPGVPAPSTRYTE